MSEPTATYDPTHESALDRVRFAVGDTDVSVDEDTGESSALKPDTEYLAAIARNDTEQGAIAEMARALAAQVMQEPDKYSEAGGISLSWSDRIKTWLALADSADARAAANGASYGVTNARKPTRGELAGVEYRRDPWSKWSDPS